MNDAILYEAIIEDPAVLAEPWQTRQRTLTLSDKPLLEPLACVEMNLDHVVDETHHDNRR